MNLLQVIPYFSSAGGGGSGGGDGGDILILIGYVPMHFLGAQFRKRKLSTIGNFVTWPVAVLYGVVLIVVFRWYGFFMAIGALLGAGAGLYGWLGKLRRNKKAEVRLQQAAALDSLWDPKVLMTYAGQVMQRFQYDWSRGDTENMKLYLTPWYHYHVSLMMSALTQAKRINRMSKVEIVEQNIQSVNDATDNTQDAFVIGFEVKANDELVDTRTGRVIFTSTEPFTEYWEFQRNLEGWLLGGITPATASLDSQNLTVRQFAFDHKFGYSLDWGWLLLPERGQLFGKGKFGVSDINNHVIGVYNSLLLQIYTYAPNPSANVNDLYLVAQAQLPKSYGDIVVRKKKALQMFGGGIKGLDKIETEWPDFNKKYDVFTSTGEGATSFELLHPAFMEVLEAQPFEVNLEVVDNVVYFYTKQTKLEPAHYPVFLGILQEAFKQMRL